MSNGSRAVVTFTRISTISEIFRVDDKSEKRYRISLNNVPPGIKSPMISVPFFEKA
jgi:hypothetical protein